MVRIRRAKIEDSPGLARVQVDSYRASYAGLLPQSYLEHFSYAEQEQDWRDLLSIEPTDDILLVAETRSGEILGYALGKPGPTSIAPYDSELVALHVRRARQRLGLGRRLVTAMAAQLQQRGCTALLVWVLEMNPARAFYERLGGQLAGQKETRLGEDVTAIEVAFGWPDIKSLA